MSPVVVAEAGEKIPLLVCIQWFTVSLGIPMLFQVASEIRVSPASKMSFNLPYISSSSGLPCFSTRLQASPVAGKTTGLSSSQSFTFIELMCCLRALSLYV